MEQRTDEWFRARAGRFTASRMADLMARTKSGPAASRGNLLATLAVERITGQCVETYQNAAMQRGTDLEPEARAAYEAHIGALVEECGLIVCPEFDYVAASPDGLCGADGMLELKCPQAMAKHLEALRTGAHALEYRWQVQTQLWCAGRQWVDVVSYDPRWPDGLQLAITRVARDEAAIEALRSECRTAEHELRAIVAELMTLQGAV